jgi:hypothetical protein
MFAIDTIHFTKKTWLSLYTPRSWAEFCANGASVAGFNEHNWKTANKLAINDHLLCYVTGVKRWVGLLTVNSLAFRGSTRIWSSDLYPCRIQVNPIIILKVENGVPMDEVWNRFANPNSWWGYIRRSPGRLPDSDAVLIEKALEEAKTRPVNRPVKVTSS